MFFIIRKVMFSEVQMKQRVTKTGSGPFLNPAKTTIFLRKTTLCLFSARQTESRM